VPDPPLLAQAGEGRKRLADDLAEVGELDVVRAQLSSTLRATRPAEKSKTPSSYWPTFVART
jgi:hypothetical protein